MKLGATELLLILALAVLLFGGTRLAGLGKAMGRSIKEFKQEVHSGDKPASDVGETSDARDQ